MSYCPYCGEEASALGNSDESVDYCYECEKCIEGQTLDFSINTIRELDDYLKLLTYTFENDTIPAGEKTLLAVAVGNINAVIYSLKEKANA